ncbi:MAG: IclR family transcriptional regulator [Burkholderiaceae bacterium]
MAVKSAQRVLEVLEYFASTHQPANVAEVCRHLGYPQSSTSMLLDSLEALGYLTYDSRSRRFRPTVRVMLLGTWIQDELFGEGSLVSVMDRLRRTTGQTVMVGLRQGIYVRFVLALRGTRADALQVRAGALASVCLSSVGKVLLANETDADILRIARHANAVDPLSRSRVHPRSLVEEVRASEQRGWAESYEFPSPGHCAIAAPLSPIPGQPPMGLCLGTHTAYMQRERPALVAALKQACEKLESMTRRTKKLS